MIIARHGPEVLDELRPLWLAMVRHHAEVAPELGPVRADDDSWARRRAHYAEQLARPGAFVLLARDAAGRAVGYALVTREDGSPTWAAPYTAVDSLSVLPGARGAGIGAALLDRAEAEGGGPLRLDVVAANAGALRFYERLGFRPDIIGLRRTRG